MSSPILEQKCPNCGAMMQFDPKTQMLICEYCGTKQKFDPEKIQPESCIGDFKFEDFRKGYEDPQAAALPIYLCKSCGAELIAPPEQFATTCPYCRNNIVLSDKVSGNLRPNGIIPFEVTADSLPERMREAYKDRKLLPKAFFSKTTMSGITGVYVPFWLFSGNITGEAEFITSRKTVTKTHDYETTEIKYYSVNTAVDLKFDDLPVDASKRIDNDLMDSLEPFDMTKAKPFDIGYLAGFTADRFDTPSGDLESRAKRRIENTANQMLGSQVNGYDTARRASGNLQTKLDAKYYLLPVYLFKLGYLGKKYDFAVNGQTGKVIGHLPEFKNVSTMYFLLRFLGVFGAFLGIFIVKYFLGG